MNYQKPTKTPRKAVSKKAEPKTEEQKIEDKKVGNMKMQEKCAPLIGRSVNYVDRVGLGTLRVITADGTEDQK
jgi:hypothetical protein